MDRGGVFGREGEQRLAWYEQRQRGKTAFEIYSVRIGLVLYGFIIEISYCIGLCRGPFSQDIYTTRKISRIYIRLPSLNKLIKETHPF